MAIAILRIDKLKGNQVRASDEHTERQRETKNADLQKLKDNIYLIGESGLNLREAVDDEIAKSSWTTKTGQKQSGKPRPDSVECIEFLMTASPEFFGDTESEKLNKALEFAEKAGEYMKKNEERGLKFVKAVIHMDEKTPHIVAYAIPLDPNGKLNAKHHYGGNKWRMAEHQDEFAEVMEPLGLERGIRGSQADHQTIQKYYGKINRLAQIEEERRMFEQQAEDMKRMMDGLTKALNQQMNNRSDITLRDAASAFLPAKQLAETSQGLAVLKINEPNKILAIVTPDNKAFAPTGEKLSNGSSVQFLMATSGAPLDKVLSAIENKFDGETREKSARAYGDELAMRKNDAKEHDFRDAEREVKVLHTKAEISEQSEITQGRKM